MIPKTIVATMINISKPIKSVSWLYVFLIIGCTLILTNCRLDSEVHYQNTLESTSSLPKATNNPLEKLTSIMTEVIPSPTIISQSTSIRSVTPTATSELLPTLSLTPTSLILPTEAPIQTPLPDLLINTSQAEDLVECNPHGTSQIWLLKYPYEQGKLLLSDPIENYLYPAWSPNGEWIAYITSRASKLYADGSASKPEGTNSVWVMHPDGSEKHRISELFSRIDFIDENQACYKFTEIQPFLSWSPDGRYIGFTQSVLSNRDDYKSGFYLIDLKAGKTTKMPDVVGSPPAAWSPTGRQLVLFGKEHDLIILDIDDQGNLYTSKVLLPETKDVLSGENAVWLPDRPNPYVTLRDKTNDTYSTWEVDLATGTWSKLFDLSLPDNDQGYSPSFGRSWAITCGKKSNMSYFIDLQTFKIVGSTINEDNGFDFACGLEKWLRDSSGDDIVSYRSPSIGGSLDHGEIWVIKPQAGRPEAHLLFAGSDLKLPEGYRIIDYSWKP
jgi:hypothetical protein